jgi:hypothetical protein
MAHDPIPVISSSADLPAAGDAGQCSSAPLTIAGGETRLLTPRFRTLGGPPMISMVLHKKQTPRQAGRQQNS